MSTEHVVVIVSSVAGRGQYDYSSIYKINADYIENAVEDVSDSDDFKGATAKNTTEFLQELDFGGGDWEWMHLADNTKKMLDLLDKHAVVDLHEQAVADDFDDDNELYFAGKSIDAVCDAALAKLATLPDNDNEWALSIKAALQQRDIKGF